METPIIQLVDVHKRFGDTVVLDGVTFDIDSGSITTIIGKSGTGKSVLLKHIIGLMTPDSGDILFKGRSILSMSKVDRSRLRSQIGYLFQSVALFDSMTVFDNVALPLREKTARNEKEIKHLVEEILTKLEIADTAKKYPAEISGGMRKRVGLARALITKPKVVLFDEPTSGLDPIRRNAVHSMIAHMQGKFAFSAVIVSHEIPEVFYLSHKIVMLHGGMVYANGTPDEIMTTDDPVVRGFIRGTDAETDDITGMLKRHSIIDRLLDTQIFSTDTDDTCNFVVFKIENLDAINEQLGFIEGQKCCQQVARKIDSKLSSIGDSSKYSDDIIVVMVPDEALERAHSLINVMSREMCEGDNPENGETLRCTLSVRICTSVGHDSIDEVVKGAAGETQMITRVHI